MMEYDRCYFNDRGFGCGCRCHYVYREKAEKGRVRRLQRMQPQPERLCKLSACGQKEILTGLCGTQAVIGPKGMCCGDKPPEQSNSGGFLLWKK
jgi:hypothetical protein